MATTPTLKTISGMIAAKVIKRTDKGMFIDFKLVHIDPTFNRRRETPRLHQSIEDTATFLIDQKAAAEGKKKVKDLSEAIPQLEVYPDGEGGVIIVEGHRRKRALMLLHERGYEIPLIPIKPFTGTEQERRARIVTSNSQLELEPIELGLIYKEYRDIDGFSQEQIAQLMGGKTRQHVEQMLKIADAPVEVQEQIATGIISAGTAVAIVRQHGDNAAQVIAQEHENAKAQGKKKVTDGTIQKAKASKPATPSVPRALAADMTVAANRVAREVPDDAQALLERYRKGESALGDHTVSISIRSLNALLISVALINDAQAEAARKEKQSAQEADHE